MAVENLHIKRVKVENYKSLKNSEIELKEGVNVIIGRNGAGKSNLLEFIKKYTTFFPHNLLKAMNSSFTISYEYTNGTRNQSFSYSIEKIKSTVYKKPFHYFELTLNESVDGKNILEDQKLEFNDNSVIGTRDLAAIYNVLSEDLSTFTNFLVSYVSFTTPLNVGWLTKPGKVTISKDRNYSNYDIDEVEIDEYEYSSFNFVSHLQTDLHPETIEDILRDGNNSADSIKVKITNYFSEYLDWSSINEVLQKFTLIKGIRFNPNINVYQTLEKIFIENLVIDFNIGGDWLPWSSLSDGTKRMFYLISEALSLKDGILLVEEPELGIHPHQLYKIMDFLKEQSRDKQIIISTHSPLVLDALDENELDRIVIAKYENGTKFNHLTEAQIAKARKYMNEVGELSYYWLHSDLEE